MQNVTSLEQLWTVVWTDEDGHPNGGAVPPLDDSMGGDTGMLVYIDEGSAKSSADHQNELYHDEKVTGPAMAMRLDRFFSLPVVSC